MGMSAFSKPESGEITQEPCSLLAENLAGLNISDTADASKALKSVEAVEAANAAKTEVKLDAGSENKSVDKHKDTTSLNPDQEFVFAGVPVPKISSLYHVKDMIPEIEKYVREHPYVDPVYIFDTNQSVIFQPDRVREYQQKVWIAGSYAVHQIIALMTNTTTATASTASTASTVSTAMGNPVPETPKIHKYEDLPQLQPTTELFKHRDALISWQPGDCDIFSLGNSRPGRFVAKMFSNGPTNGADAKRSEVKQSDPKQAKKGGVDLIQLRLQNVRDLLGDFDLPCSRAAVDAEGRMAVSLQCLYAICTGQYYLPSVFYDKAHFLKWANLNRHKKNIKRDPYWFMRSQERIHKYATRGFTPIYHELINTQHHHFAKNAMEKVYCAHI